MPVDDSRTWTLIEGESPVIATAIHNGHEIRQELEGLFNLNEVERLYEEDPYTGEWVGIASTNIVVHRSRFECDLNRPREKAVYLTPEDAWGLKVWKNELSEDAYLRSLEYYDEYYGQLRDLLKRKVDNYGRFVLLDLHSYNHRRNGIAAPVEGNPEVIVGTSNMDRQFWAPVVDGFINDLRSFDFNGRSLDVRENVKFAGGHQAMWIHKNFPGTGCDLAIEFKKVFMDEHTGVPDWNHIRLIGDALLSTIENIPGNLEIIG